MKVYVCYCDYGYEGYSMPDRVFLKESDAIAWVAETKGNIMHCREYDEMEVE